MWRLARGRPRNTWPLAWPIAAFIAVTILAAALSARPGESLVSARTAFLLLSVWVLIDALPTVEAAAHALLALLAVLGVVSLLGIGQVMVCTEPWFIRTGEFVFDWWPSLGRFFMKCYRAHAFYSIYMTLGGVLDIALLATLPTLREPRTMPRWCTGR